MARVKAYLDAEYMVVNQSFKSVVKAEASIYGQVKLATVLESFQYKRSDSFGVNPPLY